MALSARATSTGEDGRTPADAPDLYRSVELPSGERRDQVRRRARAALATRWPGKRSASSGGLPLAILHSRRSAGLPSKRAGPTDEGPARAWRQSGVGCLPALRGLRETLPRTRA